MEALLLADGAYIRDRHRELEEEARLAVHERKGDSKDDASVAEDSSSSVEPTDLERETLDRWHIVQRAMSLDARWPTSQLRKKLVVLEAVLERLYAPDGGIPCVTSPSNKSFGWHGAALTSPSRSSAADSNSPVPFKDLPLPTQIALRMFFRACQSLRDPAKLATNSRLSVQIASKLPSILANMPSCVLSPGVVDDTSAESEECANVWSVFQQLFQLFAELLGLPCVSASSDGCTSTAAVQNELVYLTANERAIVITAYVALSLKWGRLRHLLTGLRLLLESGNELSASHFEPLVPLFHDLVTATVEHPPSAFAQEEQCRGYLMSFGKGDHGKLGHGQCTHVSCQEGNCTENKAVPTVIAATRDISFRKIDSLSTHSIAITAKGEAVSWGNGDKYRLGHGSSTKEYTPRTIDFLSLKGRVRDLACGLGHTLALMESGELYAWGNGSNGRLGTGDTSDRSNPTKVVLPASTAKVGLRDGVETPERSTVADEPLRFRHIFCGASHSLGLSWDGRAFCWGKNNQGQCGHGHTNDQWTIQEIESFRNNDDEEAEYVVHAAGGWEHTLFCTASGRVYSCGCGYKDSRRAGIPPVLGHGDCDRRLEPTLVEALEDSREEFVKVACGWDHSLAVSASGRVYTWGSGTNGKLGHGDEENCDIPTLVRSMEGEQVKEAKAGCEHTVLLTHDHELWTCGQEDSGRLGHGDNQTRKCPTKVELFAQSGLKPVAIAVGDKYNLVLVDDGDGQCENDEQSERQAIPRVSYRTGCDVNERITGRDLVKIHPTRRHGSQQRKPPGAYTEQFGANWVLDIAKNENASASDSPNLAAMKSQSKESEESGVGVDFAPACASDVIMFIVGHIDRIASGYLAVQSEPQSEARHGAVGDSMCPQPRSVLLPFAVDTGYDALYSLLQLLQRELPTTDAMEGGMTSSSNRKSRVLDEATLTGEQRMALALSSLRILQLNLSKGLGDSLATTGNAVDVLNVDNGGPDLPADQARLDLFSHIHQLLDKLAALDGREIVNQFQSGGYPTSNDKHDILAIGTAISQEAARALKMGFVRFYPSGLTRCNLLWEILDDRGHSTPPSMRTVVLSEQLSEDSTMKELFRHLLSDELSQRMHPVSADISNNTTGKDESAMKALMLSLLLRSSAKAGSRLEVDASPDFTHEPDCFLRILHVLQTHCFSLANQFLCQRLLWGEKIATDETHTGVCDVYPRILDSLLDYLDALFVESLTILKRLHKASCQHEEIITWRLNGSFFHVLFPSAVECLSILLKTLSRKDKYGVDGSRIIDIQMQVVERVLPKLHPMLKMLDEVSWKMHSTVAGGNQIRDESAGSDRHYIGSINHEDEERNWFVDLGDSCAILCGKLSCQLFDRSKVLKSMAMDTAGLGSIYSLVLSEGQFLPDEYALWTRSGDGALFSKPIATILDWESVGVFEVEDELVESEDLSQSGSGGNTLLGPSEIHNFLLIQFTEAELSGKSQAFWVWVVERLSRSGGFSEVLVPSEMQHLLGVIASVAVWHLNLVPELQNCYRLYEKKLTSPNADNCPASTSGKLWELFAAVLEHLKRVAQLDGPIDGNGVTNAVTTARFLLKLQPNSELMSPILRASHESTAFESRWKSADDFATDLIRFLNQTVDLTALRVSIAANSVDISLLRTGLCIFHDLLRKLTSSSAKTCLLAEFVDVVCAKGGPTCSRNLVKLMSNALNQLTILDQKDAKSLGKAVENLFVRVTRIISSDDSSFELKKKALIVWTVPLAVSRRDASGAVDLIAKAGIVSVVTELLLEEAGVVGTHISMNTMDRFNIVEHETGNHGVGSDRYRWLSFPSLKPGADPRLSPKMTPVKALLFAQTTAQTLGFLAWESFCAVSMLLSKSTSFGEQSPALLLRPGGSIATVQGKEPLTPRAASLSPRKRLTLPKKTIVSTIDQSIEQMSDGLFLMLQKVRDDLKRITNSVQELTSVLTPSKTLARSSDNTSRLHNDSRVFLLGSPVQTSMSSKHVVQIYRPDSTSDATTGATAFTLSFWVYVDETGAMAATPHTEGDHGDDLPPDDGNMSEHTVCVLALGAGTREDVNPESDQSACEKEDEDITFVAYTRETSAEHVSLGLSFKLEEDGEAAWRSVLIGDKLPSGQWVHVALVVDVEAREQLQAFVDGKRSALSGERISHGHGLQFPSKYLQVASSWTRMTVGGELDSVILAQTQAEGNQIQSPNCLQSGPFRKSASKQNQMGFAAILDDVLVIGSALTEKAITRLRNNGTVLFRLKLQHAVESHCTNVLHLLCRLSEANESNHHDSSIADVALSDRWISLLVRMLLDTCRGQELAQVQICTLLQRTLPHFPPPPDLDLKSLGQVLFGPFDGDQSTAVEWQRMEEVFSAFQGSNGGVGNHVDAFAGIGKQNEPLYLLMQQHGMLHRIPQRSNNGSGRSQSTREVTIRASLSEEMKLSVRFAAGVHLFQKLYHASAWMSCMDGLVANVTGTFRSAAGLEQMLQSSEATFAGLVAVISTIAGYSEEALNLHCGASQKGATMWTSANFLECRAPFASVAPIEDGNIAQANHLQALVTAMLGEGMRRAICLSARKDLLTEHDNDILAVHSVDRKIARLAHLRARVLRFFMVSLIREQQPTAANKPWHRFLLDNDTVFENLLQVASSNSKDFVTDALGPDAKAAMKLPRLRVFRREFLCGQNDRRASLTRWSLLDLERLQWRLWEEMNTSQSSTMTSLWWQQRSSINGKVSLEVIGGDVELNELRVKALEHFPTVKLAQAKISANSGLWFYEVLLLTDGLMQIGYVDGDFTADPHQGQGVGDHFNSWAFDGFRCKKWNVNSYDYGEHWRADDVVGVLLDTDRMELSYFLNGKCLGVAFSSLPIIASSQMCPAVSLNAHQSAQFNFGADKTASLLNQNQLSTSRFCHPPVFDSDEDHSRVQAVVFAVENGRAFENGAASLVDKQVEAVEDGNASESGSIISDSDSDIDEIAVQTTEYSLEARRTAEREYPDGTTDLDDGAADQRRRDLVDGLTGLGFPLEWATRCAAETNMTSDETGAVSRILEQIEQAGLGGTSRISSSSTNDEDRALDAVRASTHWNTRIAPPDVPTSQGEEKMAIDSTAFIPRDLVTPSEQSNIHELQTLGGLQSEQNAAASEDALLSKGKSDSATSNAFLASEKQDKQVDEGGHETFPSGSYDRGSVESLAVKLQLSEPLEASTEANPDLRLGDAKRDVSDLLPLRVATDSSIFVVYTRQYLLSFLLLALREEERTDVYQMVRVWVLNPDSSARFLQFVRLALGFESRDTMVEFCLIYEESATSEQVIRLQRAMLALLQFELQHSTPSVSSEAGATDVESHRFPLFRFLCDVMIRQCDQANTLMTASRIEKRSSDSASASPLRAAWFEWISSLVLAHSEIQALGLSGSESLAPAGMSELRGVIASTCYSLSFTEKLVAIAASSSTAVEHWRYVAFKLISRILFVVRSCDEIQRRPSLATSSDSKPIASTNRTVWFSSSTSAYFDAAQLSNIAELFALRSRRETCNSVFFSELTCTLFALLVRSSEPSDRVSGVGSKQRSGVQRVTFQVNGYSSTHAIVSWNQSSLTQSAASISEGTAESAADGDVTNSTSSTASTIMSLESKLYGANFPGSLSADTSESCPARMLPSKGTFTIRNLLPDTRYLFRLVPVHTLEVQIDKSVGDPECDPPSATELILQTPPEPQFELDGDTAGTNLVLFNRNLSAKNTANKKWHSVRGSVAFDDGVHQWHVRLDTCVSKNIFIGVCTAQASMENYIGSDAYGYGFLANKAVWHNKAKIHSYGEIFKQGDLIQVTLDCNAKTLAFSRNGEYLGIAATNLHVSNSRNSSANLSNKSGSEGSCKWYPAFSMYNKDDKVTFIPPSPASMFSKQQGRPQNASVFELIEAMQNVLVYKNHVEVAKSTGVVPVGALFAKAFEVFERWKRGELIFRQIAIGHVIAIDASASATSKYGLAKDDSVFTSKGQCVVLGEYRHELWYECDDGSSSTQYGAATSQVASWNLNACREMLEAPDDFPVHHHHKHKLESTDPPTTEGADSDLHGENEKYSLQSFIDFQNHWGDDFISVFESDAKLITLLDSIATSRGLSSPLLLSLSDISTALLLEKVALDRQETKHLTTGPLSDQVITRIGLLLHINQCLYNVIRLAMPNKSFGHSASSVAASLNLPHWALEDPAAFTQLPALAARMLFSSQKEQLINEDLRKTKTANKSADSTRELAEQEDSDPENDLLVVKVSYPSTATTTFWESHSCTSAFGQRRFCLTAASEASIFAQVAQQLAAQDAKEWRRESSQPFEAIPISQTFQVLVDNSLGLKVNCEGGKTLDQESKLQQEEADDDGQQVQQPSSKQTAQYLHVFETAVREIQSPHFPLFAPFMKLNGATATTLQLDVNTELFSPSALAHSRVGRPKLLLWYFCFGQLLGIAWRSKLLLPLQFLSVSFWEELVNPATLIEDELFENEHHKRNKDRARRAAIHAVRDGLFSIIPSRCVSLSSGITQGLRERLSDLDVGYVARLERHATYNFSRQSHHDLFWKVVGAFTSVERRMLQQFITPERRGTTMDTKGTTEAETSALFVLEIAEALADGRDHPDACFPVVVAVDQRSSRLHLPAYSSAQMLRHKLLLAMTNVPFM